MALDNFRKKVSDVKEKVSGLTIESSTQVMQWLDEYKKAVQSLQVFGLTIGKIHINAGILPEISTTLKGSINNIDPEKLNEMLEAKKDEKLLAAILSALLTLSKIREVVDLNLLHEVIINVSIGLNPRVSIDLQ